MSDIAKFILLIVGAIAYFILMPFIIWAHPLAPVWLKIGLTGFLVLGLFAIGGSVNG